MAEFTGHGRCPTCGHHTSAWVGGGCTVFVPSTEEEIASGASYLRWCLHDCSVDMLGESLSDQIARSLHAPGHLTNGDDSDAR